MKALKLYSVRVGNTGYFYVAAEDNKGAVELGEQWGKEHKLQNPQVQAKLVKKPVYVKEGFSI